MKKIVKFYKVIPYLSADDECCDDCIVEPLSKVQVAKEVVHFESRPWAY